MNYLKKKNLNQPNIDLEGLVRRSNLYQEMKIIDLEELFSLQDNSFIEPVSKSIYNMISQSTSNSEQMLIGVNYYGALLAAIIGYKFNIPFTYCFNGERYVDEIEKEIEDIESLENKSLYLITDVMISGSTICKVIDALCEKQIINCQRKVDIIVIFERESDETSLSKAYENLLVRNIYVLNDSL